MSTSLKQLRTGALTGLALLGLSAQTAEAAVRRLPPERALAGIRIGTRGVTVLQKFGEPTSITVGNPVLDPNGGGMGGFGGGAGPTSGPMPGASQFAPGGGYGPGGGAPGGGMRMGAAGIPDPRGGIRPQMSSGPGPLPGSGGYGPGGGSGMSGPMGGGDVMAAEGQDVSQRLITWTYKYPKQGLVLDFQLDEDGRVVQIVGTGLRANGRVRTSRGVTFGDRYSTVLARYGFPESQSQPGAGAVILADYRNKARVAFQFINQRIARIIVAELQ